MAEKRESVGLRQRKAELLAQSAGLRCALAAELAQLQPAMSVVESAANLVRWALTLSQLGSMLTALWTPSEKPARWWRTLRALWQYLSA